jgi:hypothetical protein
MNSRNLDYNKNVLLISLSLYCIYIPLKTRFPLFFLDAHADLQLLFFAFSSSISFFILENALKKSPKEFVLYYLSVLTAKFLSLLTIVIIYFKIYKKLNGGFATTLLTAFFVFTVFELIFYLKMFKK